MLRKTNLGKYRLLTPRYDWEVQGLLPDSEPRQIKADRIHRLRISSLASQKRNKNQKQSEDLPPSQTVSLTCINENK